MSLVCRGIRGATTAEANTKAAIVAATSELLERLIQANDVREEDVAAVLFTTTRDLNAEFPAVAARQLGWTHTALMDGHEMAVPDDLTRCIRVLILVNTSKGQQELVHIYLREATNLRSRGTQQ